MQPTHVFGLSGGAVLLPMQHESGNNARSTHACHMHLQGLHMDMGMHVQGLHMDVGMHLQRLLPSDSFA